MHIISIANQKGGVGKTTTTINLSTALAAVGRRVLVVDMDPQGNASTGLGLYGRDRKKGSYEFLLENKELSECATATRIPGLYLLPASSKLSGAEVELVSMVGREYKLRHALSACADRFDYVLVDCPPSLGFLTVNALSASGRVLIPLQCEFYALDGLSQLLNTIKRIQMNLNGDLRILGIALTMYDKRNALCVQVAEDVARHFNDLVFKTPIPRNIKVSEAPSHGVPVMIYDVSSAGSVAYMRLAGEILQMDGGLDDVKCAS